MKVLMKKDLKKVGKKGEIVDVSDGFGANYVIRNGYGVLYTEKSKKEYENQLKLEKIEDEKKREEAQKVADTLKGITLEFSAFAGRNGTMTGTVSHKEIIETLKQRYNIVLNKNMIVDKNIIVNGFGTTTLKLDLYKGVLADLKIHVSLKEKK